MTTTSIVTQNILPTRDQLPELPKPRCVRISTLPEDVSEIELKNWLLTLEPSQKTRKLHSNSFTSVVENPAEWLVQFHLARNGKNKQATVTFTTTPDIFDQEEKDVIIEGYGKPWDGSVADFHFEGMTIAYAPPEGTHIQAELVKIQNDRRYTNDITALWLYLDLVVMR